MMNPYGMMWRGQLLPTRITRQTLTGAKCNTDQLDKCNNIFDVDGGDETVFIADVERFMLLIEHSVESDRHSHIKSHFLRGSVMVCDDPAGVRGCAPIEIPRGRNRSDDVFHAEHADWMSVGALLRFAGVHLDESTNFFSETRRMEGLGIQINVEYQNLRPFLMPPWKPLEASYVYNVQLLPMNTFKEVTTVMRDDQRVIMNQHGIFINVKLSGYIATFDMVNTLLVLASALALLSISYTIVDSFATYCWTYATRFYAYKWVTTVNFNSRECCPTLCSGGISTHRRKVWEESKEKFVRDFISLDGECLRDVAQLIHDIHHYTEELDQRQSTHREIQHAVALGLSRCPSLCVSSAPT